ncbi:Protein of unknown function precursor [Flavobacterium branchiophilum FL-15]|uniref:SGNH hydrolase-type esterase domain-containing protein n=2 Tax=Flavobacterium branchiophilum TaxID=55197 RepID=G2Z5A6_FLABF|nr:Protein of unknown function precursor [Flavobacterium branchiophilum FL-15]
MMPKNISFILLIFFINTMKSNIYAQDWANLSKYQSDNIRIIQEAKPIKAVFMGDSITEFWLAQQPDFFSSNNYINRGISGQTTPQMLLRFRQDVVALKPKIVVILAGINDIAGNTGETTLETITNNIQSMIEIAKANHIKVILCAVLPANDFYWNPNKNPANQVIDLNKMLKNYAEKNKISFVDYYKYMVDNQKGLQKTLSPDGVHPNLKGYQVMQPLLQHEIQNILKK